MRPLFALLTVVAVSLSAWGQSPAQKTKASPLAEYAGDWIATLDGKVWLLLQLDLHGDQLTGWLTHARDLDMNDEGGLRSASDEKVKEAITEATLDPDGLLLTVKYGDAKETDQYRMRLIEPGKAAELKMVAMEMPPGMPKPKPWTLLKFPAGDEPKAH
jgi:hypothetical protein